MQRFAEKQDIAGCEATRIRVKGIIAVGLNCHSTCYSHRRSLLYRLDDGYLNQHRRLACMVHSVALHRSHQLTSIAWHCRIEECAFLPC